MTNPGKWRGLWLCCFLLLAPFFSTQPLQAAEPGPHDPVEVEAFFDAQLTTQMEEYGIPGAAVVVVADGEILFAKGYGYANSETRTPVVAEKTLFHIGSITKLFTWTAVMQLVEQGRLDLHADINTYLKSTRFPDTFPEPITMENLLTHTPGLEDRLSNLVRLSRDDGMPLDVFVDRQRPERVLPPGEIVGYSNYGGTLGGDIVQEVSGMPFENYVEQNIFAPLGMTRSSIRHPIPPELSKDVSWGHVGLPWGIRPMVEYFPSTPMVGVSATVIDMAKFMMAHLQDGCLSEGHCILQKETEQDMQRQHFTHDPRLPGVTYGFVEWQRNGQRILWHSGSTPFFQGILILIPEENVGMFVSYNRKTGSTELGKFLRQAFLDHYYPISITPPTPLPGYQERVARFVGDYHESRWAYTTADSFIYMLIRYYKARANADGTLNFAGNTYVEVEPMLFHQVDGQGVLLFHEDNKGRIQYGFYDYDPHKVFIRMAWYETLPFHLTVLIACQAVFFSTLIHWHSIYKEIRQWLRWLGVVYMVYIPAMFIIGLSAALRVMPDLSFFSPLLLASLILVLVASGVLTVLAWENRRWSGETRFYCAVVFIAGLVFCAWLNHWNLLGIWRF
ncbi:MAG: beta-lactamase family protein [Anaerolineae bacterium]|nr:beta-lactamase family protein [Anaerolineae bacterium]